MRTWNISSQATFAFPRICLPQEKKGQSLMKNNHRLRNHQHDAISMPQDSPDKPDELWEASCRSAKIPALVAVIKECEWRWTRRPRLFSSGKAPYAILLKHGCPLLWGADFRFFLQKFMSRSALYIVAIVAHGLQTPSTPWSMVSAIGNWIDVTYINIGLTASLSLAPWWAYLCLVATPWKLDA